MGLRFGKSIGLSPLARSSSNRTGIRRFIIGATTPSAVVFAPPIGIRLDQESAFQAYGWASGRPQGGEGSLAGVAVDLDGYRTAMGSPRHELEWDGSPICGVQGPLGLADYASNA